MATLDDFLPGVEGIFGEILIPVLYAQIRRAAIELCSRSLIWKERYALALVNEQSLYDLPVPAGSRPSSCTPLCRTTAALSPGPSSSLTWNIRRGANPVRPS